MSSFLGIDVGGTKIAAAVYSESGSLVAESKHQTPRDYDSFLQVCRQAVDDLESSAEGLPAGVSIAGMINRSKGAIVVAPNLPFAMGKPVCADLSVVLSRPVRLENDANCAALAEAVDGAGAPYDLVFGLIIGTGVGGAIVFRKQLIVGANGLAGEWGHTPMPFRSPETLFHSCACGQEDCIEGVISGLALSRLYERKMGQKVDAQVIAQRAKAGEAEALRVLDFYYEEIAKAMSLIFHTIDPEAIVVSGGVSALAELYEEIPKRWGRYALEKTPKTALIPAIHGNKAGLRGAAWLWRS